jgi:hypothetical protein
MVSRVDADHPSKDGTTLRTLADVRAFILNGPEHIQKREVWQHAAQLLLDAAETPAG